MEMDFPLAKNDIQFPLAGQVKRHSLRCPLGLAKADPAERGKIVDDCRQSGRSPLAYMLQMVVVSGHVKPQSIPVMSRFDFQRHAAMKLDRLVKPEDNVLPVRNPFRMGRMIFE